MVRQAEAPADEFGEARADPPAAERIAALSATDKGKWRSLQEWIEASARAQGQCRQR